MEDNLPTRPSLWSVEELQRWFQVALSDFFQAQLKQEILQAISLQSIDGAKAISLCEEELEKTLGIRGLLAKQRVVQLVGKLRYWEELHDNLLAAKLMEEELIELQENFDDCDLRAALEAQLSEVNGIEDVSKNAFAAISLDQDTLMAFNAQSNFESMAALERADRDFALRLSGQRAATSSTPSSRSSTPNLYAGPSQQASTSRGIWIREPTGSVKDDDARSDISELSSCYADFLSSSMSGLHLGVDERLGSLHAISPGQLVEVKVGEDGFGSIIRGIWKKPLSHGKGKSKVMAEVPKHLLRAFCGVCLEPIWTSDAITAVFHLPRGRHSSEVLFCQLCLHQLFTMASTDDTLVPVGFEGTVIDQSLADIILEDQPEVLRTFRARLEEVTCKNKMYCPRSHCSAFINLEKRRPPVDSPMPCPGCKDLLCGNCKSRWHTGFSCAAFQRLPASEKETIAEREVVGALQAEGVQRCSRCHMFVELTHGCYHMTCRCRHSFCYLCGATWKTCACPQWDENRLLRAAAQRVQQNPQVQQMDRGQFQQAVEVMAEALRVNHACPGHSWLLTNPPVEVNCRNCGYFLSRYCYVCANPTCGTVVCRTCRYFRNVPL
eukprot:jgi/Botrbrau1/9537/Bobra.0211s0027.1